MTATAPFHLDGGEPFSYRDGVLHVGGLPVDQLARTAGTPLYLYDLDAVAAAYRRLAAAFRPGQVLYSVKANGNLSLLRRLAALGAGFDVVSGGELLRVNPDVEAGPHPYLRTGHDEAKFGLPACTAVEPFRRVAVGAIPNLVPVGVHVHAGSQLADPAELAAGAGVAVDVLRAGRQAGLALDRVDVGGGLPVSYDGGPAPCPEAFATALAPLLAGSGARLQVEPGRALAARAGALVARVLATKPRPAGRAVVVVTGGEALLSRQRETWEDLLAWELRPARRLPIAGPRVRQPAGSRP